MIMSLFVVVWTSAVSVVAVIAWGITHEAVLQRLVALLVPFKMTYHFLLLYKYSRMTIQTMEMLPTMKMDKKKQFFISIFQLITIFKNQFTCSLDLCSRDCCIREHWQSASRSGCNQLMHCSCC